MGKKGLNWKKEAEMQKELEKKRKEWKEGESRDGYILAAEAKETYKKVAYLIKVLRYFTLDEGFKPLGRCRITDMHALLEYPEETKKIAEIIHEINQHEEFLYSDTLHSWNDNQTIEEQIDSMIEQAKRDIESIPEYKKQIDDKINDLKKLKEKIENFEKR